MLDLTPLLQAIIGLCAAAITLYAIPWLKQKAGQERTQRLYNLAKIAVSAAEQMYGPETGKEKAEYVMDYLRKHGFNVSVEELRGALEAAVYEMNAAIDRNGTSVDGK